MQTTYENFRYRYDEKENPYNKGMTNNLREIFFSRIPPSMNDFRAFVEEDEFMDMEANNHNFMGSVRRSSKEKIDIEMGSKFGDSNGGLSLPDILRNLEYDEIEDDMKYREGSGRYDSNRSIVHVEEDLKEETRSSFMIETDANAEEEKLDGIISEETKASRSNQS